MPEIAQVSFSKGEISPIAGARTDSAFYANALLTAENFFIRAEGAASNRPGLQFIAACASNTPNGSYLLPFIYNNQSAYLTEFSAGNIRIYLNGVAVQSIGSPYALSDLPNLRWAQSADTMNVVVVTQPMYQLKRLSVSSFTYTAPTFLFGPFQDLNTDGTTTVYASATQGTVTLTASSGIFKPAHVGALFTLQEQFLASIVPWEAQKIIVYPNASSPVGMYMRSDGKIYQCVNSAPSTDHTATGTFQPVHTAGTQQDGDGLPVPSFVNVAGVSWQFVSTNAGVAQITQYISPTQVKAVVQSYKGIYANFPPTVVGGPQTVQGPFTFSGDGTTAAFSPLTAITTADPNQFYVTIGGVFQDPSTYDINLPGTSITFNTPPAVGANNIVVTQITGTLTNIYSDATQANLVPIKGLCLSTYWAFGSINAVQGYASDVCYYNDRLVLGGTALQPQTLFTSKVSDYLNFGVSTPQVDSDAITETINSRQQNPINNLLPMNNLLLGTASASWRVTDTSGIGAITPSSIALIPQEFFGMQPIPAVQTGTTIIYAQWGGRKLRDIIFQFYNDKFLGAELTLLARQMFPVNTTVTRMAFAPEPYGLLFCVRSDGVLCVCTYLPEQQVLAWTRYLTSGFFEDVCVLPENNAFSVYVIVRRVVQGTTVRYIERFAQREYGTLQDAFFVDSGLTYDGRNTTSTTMLVAGGSTWNANDTGTLTSSVAEFASTDPALNNAVWLNDASGNRLCRLQITAFTSSTQVSVKFLDPVPVAVRGVGTANWSFARTHFTGLTNLIGQTVSVYADGAVQPQQVVDGTGAVTLPNAGAVVHAGLPYACRLESLNLSVQNAPSIRNVAKNVQRLSVIVDESAPFKAGSGFDALYPVQQRQFEPYGAPTTLHTGVLPVYFASPLDDDATVCVQQDDPVPLTVLGWIADVELGEAQ